jgi:beta-alanine--pyruvate transaminase
VRLVQRLAEHKYFIFDLFERCFADDVLVRHSGSAIALAPALVIEKHEIDRVIETVRKAIIASSESF